MPKKRHPLIEQLDAELRDVVSACHPADRASPLGRAGGVRAVTRRKFIAGMGAGTGLLLPMFRNMMPEAMGQSAGRKRIIFYAGAVSASEPHFPKSDGSGGLLMTEGFQPLAPYRDEMLFLRGLNAPWQPQLHGPDWFTTGRDGTPGGITLDRYIAREIGQSDPVASIQLALHGCLSVSADGPGQVFPAEADPVQAYANIFGAAVMMGEEDPGAAAAKLLSERRSLLDFVRDDVSRMESRLAGAEREKLQQYLTSLRDMEGELSNLVDGQTNQSAECSDLGPPSAQGRASQAASEELIAAHVEVAVNAILCGMTSVAVLQKNCSGTYGWLGGIGNHTMWHESAFQQKVTYYNYHSGNLAKIRARLGEVTEGDGTVADNTLIVYFERSGIHHHNGQSDSFLMTIGDMGGYFNTGRHLTFDGHYVNDGFISIANAMGIDTNTYGDPNLASGPLPGLTA